MDKKLYDCLEITDLKEMLNITKDLYKNNIVYKIKTEEDKYKTITHKELREMVDYLGTALCNLQLKGKRIAIIGENRYEWEIAYLSIVCGTGIVVPLDKSLPEKEIETLIERSEIEAIFYSEKYSEIIKKIKLSEKNKLKHLISMDLNIHSNGVYSQSELIEVGKKLLEEGDREFTDAKINSEEMGIMLFTSGTTSESKTVMLSHKNICSNLMSLGSALDITSKDILLSVLPIHHVFECTVGFLLPVFKGAQIVFCDGIRHILDNLNEYQATIMACVPSIYEKIFKIVNKKIEKNEKLKNILEREEVYKNKTMNERKNIFKEVHDMFGGKIKLFISGAASLNSEIEEKYRLLGINLVQGYGLTETSPVVAIGTNKYYKIGSIGKTLPNVEAKIINKDKEGIGELIVKGTNVMLGYFQNEKATNKVIKEGWFYTGDLARIDEEGYIFICGRKKNVIVLKNGKNIFPEEIESLINKIEGVEESFIFGKQISEDKNNIKINAQIVFDRKKIKDVYKVETDDEIYNVISEKIKEVNNAMPKYKSIKGIILTETPLIKTTTNKIKRQANLEVIRKQN